MWVFCIFYLELVALSSYQKDLAITWTFQQKTCLHPLLGEIDIVLQPIVKKDNWMILLNSVKKDVDYIHWEPYFAELVSKPSHAGIAVSNLSQNPALKHTRFFCRTGFLQLCLHLAVMCQNVFSNCNSEDLQCCFVVHLLHDHPLMWRTFCLIMILSKTVIFREIPVYLWSKQDYFYVKMYNTIAWSSLNSYT